MRKTPLQTLRALLAGGLFLTCVNIQAQFILINFGGIDSSPDLPQSDGILSNWNSINTPNSGLASIIDSNGSTVTGVSLTTANFGSTPFDNNNSSAAYASESGASIPSWVDTDALEIPFYSNVASPGTIVFSGLTESAYQIDFIAARSSAGSGTQRIADYQVNGTFANSTPTGDEFSSYLDGWINASVLTWNSVSPISGEITLTGLGVPNSHFTAMRLTAITAVPEPTTISWLLGTASILFITGRRCFLRGRK